MFLADIVNPCPALNVIVPLANPLKVKLPFMVAVPTLHNTLKLSTLSVSSIDNV
jgi:hypothetical protein